MTKEPKTQALQTQHASPGEAIVRQIEQPQLRVQIARALPEHLTLDRFMRICITVLRNRDDLAKCEPVSIIASIVEAAQLGIELDPILGHGYLMPFWNRRVQKKLCIFIPGYRGLVHLMRNSGEVAQVNAEIVCAGDTFSLRLGSDRQLVHVPLYEIDRTNENLWLGVYASARFRDGAVDFEYMPRTEVEKIKARSPSKNEKGDVVGPWLTDTGEMWKKTPIRRLAKRMPLSPRLRTIIEAAIRDEYRDAPDYREAENPAQALEVQAEEPAAAGVPAQAKEAAKAEPAKPARPPRAHIPTIEEDFLPPDREPGDEPEAAEPREEKPKAGKPPAEKPQATNDRISQPVLRSLKALAAERGVTEQELLEIAGSHGYASLEEIEKRTFNSIWQDVAAAARHRPA
jgi:recombination protein RecT